MVVMLCHLDDDSLFIFYVQISHDVVEHFLYAAIKAIGMDV